MECGNSVHFQSYFLHLLNSFSKHEFFSFFHAIFHSSCFLRRPLKFDETSKFYFKLSSTVNLFIFLYILSYFCCLFRIYELFLLERSLFSKWSLMPLKCVKVFQILIDYYKLTCQKWFLIKSWLLFKCFFFWF